jgi:hypothetical protein
MLWGGKSRRVVMYFRISLEVVHLHRATLKRRTAEEGEVKRMGE